MYIENQYKCASFVVDSASLLWRADILSFGWISEEEEEEHYNDITWIIKAHLIVCVCMLRRHGELSLFCVCITRHSGFVKKVKVKMTVSLLWLV